MNNPSQPRIPVDASNNEKASLISLAHPQENELAIPTENRSSLLPFSSPRCMSIGESGIDTIQENALSPSLFVESQQPGSVTRNQSPHLPPPSKFKTTVKDQPLANSSPEDFERGRNSKKVSRNNDSRDRKELRRTSAVVRNETPDIPQKWIDWERDGCLLSSCKLFWTVLFSPLILVYYALKYMCVGIKNCFVWIDKMLGLFFDACCNLIHRICDCCCQIFENCCKTIFSCLSACYNSICSFFRPCTQAIRNCLSKCCRSIGQALANTCGPIFRTIGNLCSTCCSKCCRGLDWCCSAICTCIEKVTSAIGNVISSISRAVWDCCLGPICRAFGKCLSAIFTPIGKCFKAICRQVSRMFGSLFSPSPRRNYSDQQRR